jgi:hypothetical protein
MMLIGDLPNLAKVLISNFSIKKGEGVITPHCKCGVITPPLLLKR